MTSAAAPPGATVPADATVPAEATVPTEAAIPAEPTMGKTVAPAPMIPVAVIPPMVPAVPGAISTEAAIDRIVRGSVGGVTHWLRHATGQGKSDAEKKEYGFRDHRTANHRCLQPLSFTCVPAAPTP